MMAVARIGLMLCIGFSFGCGSPVEQSRSSANLQRGATLVLMGADPDAEIYLDEKYVGTMGKLRAGRLTIKPGVYRLEVIAPEHYPWRGEVHLAPGEMRLNVEMLRIPLR